jgi:hypothetical protein
MRWIRRQKIYRSLPEKGRFFDKKQSALMLKNLKKTFLLSLVFFLFWGIGNVSAHCKGDNCHNGHSEKEKSRPKIEKVTSKDSHSATIKFKYKENRNEKVKVKVKITNEKTGEKYTEKFKKVKIGCDGKGKLKVENLKAGEKYCFKIKIKGPDDCEYSCKSKCKCQTVDP